MALVKAEWEMVTSFRPLLNNRVLEMRVEAKRKYRIWGIYTPTAQHEKQVFWKSWATGAQMNAT
jgi:hypothetical protein